MFFRHNERVYRLTFSDYWRRNFERIELTAIILAIALLPIDRFPYLHETPLYLGHISFLLLLLVTFVRLAQSIRESRWNSFKRYALISLLLLLPVAGFAQSITYAIDKPLAIGATELLAVAVTKGFCFFVLISHKPQLWQVVKKTIYAVATIVVTFGFFQFIFDVFGASSKITDLRDCCTSNSTYIYPRIHSVSLEPLYLANFLLLPLWLIAYEFYKYHEARRNKYLIGLFTATLTLFVLTTSRSAYLSLGVGVVVFSLGVKKEILKKIARRGSKIIATTLAAALVFVMLSGLVSMFIPKTPIHGADSGVRGSLRIFGTHSLNVLDESAQTRYSLWPRAFDLIKENPLRGVGAYNSRVALNLDEYNRGVQDIKLQPFNNDLLGTLVDLGLVGVVTFGSIVLFLIIIMYRLFKMGWDTYASPIALAFLGMLIQSNFFHSILLARFWVTIGILLAVYYISVSVKMPPKTT